MTTIFLSTICVVVIIVLQNIVMGEIMLPNRLFSVILCLGSVGINGSVIDGAQRSPYSVSESLICLVTALNLTIHDLHFTISIASLILRFLVHNINYSTAAIS